MVTKADLTRPMKRAVVMFHGSAQSASEARADARSIKALIDKGLLRWSSGPSSRKGDLTGPSWSIQLTNSLMVSE